MRLRPHTSRTYSNFTVNKKAQGLTLKIKTCMYVYVCDK